MKDRIKAIRKSLGLSQEEFGSKIEISRNGIASYEMGRTIPSNSVKSLICKEFGVNKEYLETGEGEMFIDTSTEALDIAIDMLADEFRWTNDAKAIARVYAQREDLREHIAAIIKIASEMKKDQG